MIRRLALATMVVAGASSARADGHPLVELEVDACVDAPGDEIRRVVSIELGALLADAPGTSSDRTRASVTCEGTDAVLRVDDPLTGKSLSRTIELGAAVPRARARLVALAVVELISASWTELEVNPAPRVPPSGPRPSSSARHAALATVRAQADRSARSRPRLQALAGVLDFTSGADVLGGGGLRLAHDRATLGWSVDVQAAHGTTPVSLGRVTTDVISVGAALVVQRSWSPWRTHLGLGVRGGAARLGGAADPSMAAQAATFWAPWIGPAALGDVERVVTHRLVVGLGIEGGYVLVPVGGLVGDRREVAIDGAWIGVHLGVGMFL